MTQWAKNEVTAVKRQCAIEVWKDGAPCPRGTDLMATGFVFFRGANSPSADVALGTMSNERRPLTSISLAVTADSTTEKLNHTAHGLETGDSLQITNSGGALPAPLVAATTYYVIVIDADNVKLATSAANAYAGTAIDITSNGSGTNTLVSYAGSGGVPGSERGVDGRFVYQATQTETDHDNAESEVFVDSGDTGSYSLAASSGGTAIVSMASAVQGFETVLEGSHTGADLMRLITSVLAGTVLDFSTVVLVFKSLDGTKTRLTVTTGPTGRLSIVVGDLT